MNYVLCAVVCLPILAAPAVCNSESVAATVQAKMIFLDAHAAVSEQLRDPQSAQFRHDRLVADEKLVCGEVNGKNGYGGYAGFQPYIFYATSHQAKISTGAPDFSAIVNYHGDVASRESKRNLDQVADACSFQIEWIDKCNPKARPTDWDEHKRVCENFIAMRPKVDALPTE
jgi:hypothetical protein